MRTPSSPLKSARYLWATYRLVVLAHPAERNRIGLTADRRSLVADHAGREQRQVEEVARFQRQLGDLLRLDVGADGLFRAVDERCDVRDGDGLLA